MTAARAHAERVRALVIDREPTTLVELEDILGVALPRSEPRPWRLRKRNPIAGVIDVRLAFLGRDLASLRADRDPPIEHLEIVLAEDRCDELACAMLGERSDIGWQRATGHLTATSDRLYWKRRHATATESDPEEDALLVEKLVGTVEEPLTWPRLAELFGPLSIDGWTETWHARTPRWRAQALGIDAAVPTTLSVTFHPRLLAHALVAALGWHDTVLGFQPPSLLDGRTNAHPRTCDGKSVMLCFEYDLVKDLPPGTPYAAAFRDREPLAWSFDIGRR